MGTLLFEVLNRPGIAAALSLIVMLALIAASRLKFDVTQLALTFLDFAIICLQAYIFTVLTASYVQGSLAEGH